MNSHNLDPHTEELIEIASMVEVKRGPDGEKYVEIKNAHFTTEKITAPAVITIDGDGATGWQWPIQVASPDGNIQQTKCLGCNELSTNGHVMCDRCKKALITIRGLGDEGAVSVLQVLADPSMQAFFKLLTMDGFRKYMEEQIGAIARDS